LDLTPDDQPEKVAGTLREQVRDEISLSISVGIGANKMVAQVATDDAKQRKLQIADCRLQIEKRSAIVRVKEGDEREYLSPWPTRVLPVVGPKVGGRLERLNVNQVGEVAGMPLPVLCGLFRNQGRVLHQQSHGIDPRPVEPHKPPRS